MLRLLKGSKVSLVLRVGPQCNFVIAGTPTGHFKYKYNIKTSMYTISALYQMVNWNVIAHSS